MWADAQSTYEQYRNMVKHRLENASVPDWQTAVEKHRAQVPYGQFQDGVSKVIPSIRRDNLSWEEQVGVRAWCRLRVGLVNLRAVDGRRSRRKYQHCLFCSTVV
jgi:hypothetical protein